MNQKKEFAMKRELFLKPFPSDLSLKKKDLDFTVFRDLKLLDGSGTDESPLVTK